MITVSEFREPDGDACCHAPVIAARKYDRVPGIVAR
jgi:hypothetical protein